MTDDRRILERTHSFIGHANEVIGWESSYTPSTIGTALHVDEGRRYYLVRGNLTSIHFPHGYTRVRVDCGTGHVYNPSGKVPRWSVHVPDGGGPYGSWNDCLLDMGVRF